MNRLHHLPGLFFTSAQRSGHTRAIDQGSTLLAPPEKSGNAINQVAHDVISAFLRDDIRIDAQRTKSLCCVAAGIIYICSNTPKVLIPLKRLRWAAIADTTLIASVRPHAQPAKGYKPAGGAHA